MSPCKLGTHSIYSHAYNMTVND